MLGLVKGDRAERAREWREFERDNRERADTAPNDTIRQSCLNAAKACGEYAERYEAASQAIAQKGVAFLPRPRRADFTAYFTACQQEK